MEGNIYKEILNKIVIGLKPQPERNNNNKIGTGLICCGFICIYSRYIYIYIYTVYNNVNFSFKNNEYIHTYIIVIYLKVLAINVLFGRV